MNERIGYPDFILDNDEMEKLYYGVSCSFKSLHHFLDVNCLEKYTSKHKPSNSYPVKSNFGLLNPCVCKKNKWTKKKMAFIKNCHNRKNVNLFFYLLIKGIFLYLTYQHGFIYTHNEIKNSLWRCLK